MIYLHKILPLLVSPIVIVLAVLMFGLYKKRYKFAIILAAGLLYVVSLPLVSSNLFRLIESNAIRLEPADVAQADAIVVLSGMLTWVPTKNGVTQEWADPDRFWGGIELIHAEKAPLLIFTGSKLPWEIGSGNEGDYLKKYAMRLNVPDKKILVTPDVFNTEGEAIEIMKMLAGRQNIILVTSAFHMERAKSIFESKGFTVQAYPVDFKIPEGKTTFMDFFPHAAGIGQTDLAIRELIGRVFYKMKRLISAFKSVDAAK